MKMTTCDRAFNYRNAIGTYQKTTSPRFLTCHENQLLLDKLANCRGPKQKNVLTTALLQSLIIVTNYNVGMLNTTLVSLNHKPSPLENQLTAINYSGNITHPNDLSKRHEVLRRSVKRAYRYNSPANRSNMVQRKVIPGLGLVSATGHIFQMNNIMTPAFHEIDGILWQKFSVFFENFMRIPVAAAQQLMPQHDIGFKKVGQHDGSKRKISPLSYIKSVGVYGDLSQNHVYQFYTKMYPEINRVANRQIKMVIRKSFGLDVDPDTTYFHRFSFAENDPHSITGWRHEKDKPIESRTLTQCVLNNFPADAQDNLDVVDQMGGIYIVDGKATDTFGSENELAIKPSDIARLIWELDFYKLYIKELEQYWRDTQIQEILNIYAALETLNDSYIHLTLENKVNFLKAFGFVIDDTQHIEKYFFDINGYFATDMLILRPPHPADILLYMPRVRKAYEFSNFNELKRWVVNNCFDEAHREEIAQHFAIEDRQSSFFWDGIDDWLLTFQHDDTNRYFDRICSKRQPINGHLSQEITRRQKDRAFSDGDLLIKSNDEVRLDMAARYFSEINRLLPNPFSTFVSLGLNIEKAFNGDTERERHLALDALTVDIINIVLIALTEVAFGKMKQVTSLPSHNSVNNINIESSMKNTIISTRTALESNAASLLLRKSPLLRRDFFYYTLNSYDVIIHPEILEQIIKYKIPDVSKNVIKKLVENADGLLQSPLNEEYIQIDHDYYKIFRGNADYQFYLNQEKTFRVFLDIKQNKKTFFLWRALGKNSAWAKKLCLSKRAPEGIDVSCIKYDSKLAYEFSEIDPGTDESISQMLKPESDLPHLLKNVLDERTYIKINNKYFIIEKTEQKYNYIIFKKSTTPTMQCRKGSFVNCEKIFFNEEDNTFYLDTDIARLQVLSGFSYDIAKLHVFCRTIPYDLLTYSEKIALMGFSRVDYDAINEFLREGMPADFISPSIRASLYDSVIVIDGVLQKLPSYQSTVFRGITLSSESFNKIKVNDLLHSLSYISSSADMDIAKSFAVVTNDEMIGVIFNIELKMSGHPIMLYALHAYEAEVLIERNSWFVVNKIESGQISVSELSASLVDEYRKDHLSCMTYPF